MMQLRHNYNKITQPIFVALFVFFGAFVLSAFASHSFAPVGDSSAVESEVNIEIEPSLSLAIMDKDPSNLSNGEVASTIDTMSMEVTPNASGVFVSSTAYIQASTNNATGYSLSFSDTDDNTALDYQGTIPAGTGLSTTIPAIAANSTNLTDIELDRWGYAFGDDTVFSPVPTLSNTQVLARTSTSGADAYPFTTAAKIDTAILAGTYQDSVVFSITANFVPPEQAEATISPITTTQVDGGEVFTIDTDIDFPADLTGLGDIIVYIYSTPTDKAACTSPSVVAVDASNISVTQSGEVGAIGKLRVTCTSPARAAGVYNADIELLAHNTIYTTADTVTYINPSFNVTITKGTGINQISGTNIATTTNTTATGQNQYATTVTLNATNATGYNTPTWTVTSGNTTLSSTTGASVTFTMPKEAVTVSVSGKANTYTIAYNANGGTGTTASTTATYNAAHTLRANGFSRANYIFLGWSTSSTATSATYSNSQALTAAQVNSLVGSTANGGTKTLYAVWRAMTINDIAQMQQMASTICSNTTAGTSKTLTDTRDSETYTVKKLADGKCWMTQNLRLARTKAITLTSANSDVSSNFSLPVAPTTASSWGSDTTASAVNTTHLYNTGNVSYGVYYNWYTATAGTGTYALASGTASSSICPKGWRLPTSGEFNTLYVANSSNYTTFVNNGGWARSGYYHGSGSASGQNSYGYWWSSTPNSNSYNAYILAVLSSTSTVYPQYHGIKAFGYSVRCIAR